MLSRATSGPETVGYEASANLFGFDPNTIGNPSGGLGFLSV